MDLDDFLYAVANMRHGNPKWRRGQAVFNTAYRLWPKVADDLRGTPEDCFYDDSKINDFVAGLERLGVIEREK